MQRIEEVLAPLWMVEAGKACEVLPLRTSAQKLRKFPIKDQDRIFAYLASKPTPNNKKLWTYLRAGLATGMRPAEWQETEMICEKPLMLRIKNAKYDQLRGNGKHRTLLFKEVDDATCADILSWLGFVKEAGTGYPSLQGRLADAMYSATQALWPRRSKRPTMYSTRHEFAAIAKLALSDVPDGAAILAAMMGHASDVTASNHYGRYARKSNRIRAYLSYAFVRLPFPRDDEVASVRRKLDEQKQYLGSLRKTTLSRP